MMRLFFFFFALLLFLFCILSCVCSLLGRYFFQSQLLGLMNVPTQACYNRRDELLLFCYCNETAFPLPQLTCIWDSVCVVRTSEFIIITLHLLYE